MEEASTDERQKLVTALSSKYPILVSEAIFKTGSKLTYTPVWSSQWNSVDTNEKGPEERLCRTCVEIKFSDLLKTSGATRYTMDLGSISGIIRKKDNCALCGFIARAFENTTTTSESEQLCTICSPKMTDIEPGCPNVAQLEIQVRTPASKKEENSFKFIRARVVTPFGDDKPLFAARKTGDQIYPGLAKHWLECCDQWHDVSFVPSMLSY